MASLLEASSAARRAGLAALLGWAGVAQAQPGDHIRFGQSSLAPSLAMGVAFESNPYRSASAGVPSAHFSLIPGAKLTTRAPDVHVDLGARYLLQKYFRREQSNLDRFSNFDLNGRVHLFPSGRLGILLADDASLRSRNTERPGARIAYYNHFRNHALGGLVIAAGPVMRLIPTGSWTVDRYAIGAFGGESGLLPFNERHAFGPHLRAEWDFFPMTALVVEGGATWQRYAENWAPTNNPGSDLGSFIGLPDSLSWRARAGLEGRLTKRIVVVASLGYGQSRYDEASVEEAGGDPTGVEADLVDARGILAKVQLGWALGPGQEIKVGYQRDFADSWFSNFLVYDEVYVGAGLRVGTRVGLDAMAKLRFEEYVGAVERDDVFIRGHLGGAWFLRDWASLDLRATWDQRLSSAARVSFINVGGHFGATFTY